MSFDSGPYKEVDSAAVSISLPDDELLVALLCGSEISQPV